MSQSRDSAADRLIGQVVADRYQILSVLGEGGMGRVYLAEHVRMGRKSAVKVMSPKMALAADAISRFNREAANASRINHPHVAQVYDFGETAEGMLYLAMEYIEGETLRRLIERDGPISIARATELTRQIAGALGAAHHLGIVHRDLKPDNIMLSRNHDGSDCVKVVDFGIAKTVHGSGGEAASGGSQTVTTAGVSLGTPEYMSPEQLAGERLDSRTDLYSLALVLFNMLTANLPYPRVTSKETLIRRLTLTPQTLAEVAPSGTWPPALQAALDRALAPEPADRYAAVIDFGRDVVEAATNTTIPGRPAMGRLTPALTHRMDAGPMLPIRKLKTPPPDRRSVVLAAGILIAVAAVGAGAFVATLAWASSKQLPVVVAPARTPAPVVAARDTTLPARVVTKVASAPVAARGRGAKDSAVAAPPTSPAGRGARRAGRDEVEMRILTVQAQEHFRRAAEFARKGDVQKVRAEYAQAAPVIGLLRRLSAGTPDAAQVEQALRNSSIQAIQACRAGLADSATRSRFPANFRCEQLLPPGARGQRTARTNPSSRLDR